jgi:hypothetical protein
MTLSMRSRIIAITAACILALTLLVIFQQHNATQALRAELAAMRAQSAETARLQLEVERLRGAEAEARRLREENRELPRLRGDAARLRRELLAATNQSARPMPTHAAASASGSVNETNSATFTGTARASLAPGQTLVMGGWPLAPGKRTLALFTPNASAAGQAGAVVIGGMFVQVPETMMSGPGWERFQAVMKEATDHGIFDAEQTKQFVKALQTTEGVDILSSPRLATTSGQAGSISIGDANGSGLDTTLIPVLAADGQTVDLTVSNSLRNLPSAAGGQKP